MVTHSQGHCLVSFLHQAFPTPTQLAASGGVACAKRSKFQGLELTPTVTSHAPTHSLVQDLFERDLHNAVLYLPR